MHCLEHQLHSYRYEDLHIGWGYHWQQQKWEESFPITGGCLKGAVDETDIGSKDFPQLLESKTI